jgi:hypothetical protein
LYWNIEGVVGKNNTFYKELLGTKPGIFFMSETWHSYPFVHKLIQQNFKIYENFGHRIHAKGRCMGGYVLGIANDIFQYITILKIHSEYCIIKVVRDGTTIHICFLYISPNSNLTFEEAFQDINIDENHCIILGDMNARIGLYQTLDITVNCSQGSTRPSKDKIVNTRGRHLIRYLNQHFLQVINGTTQSDSQGEFTFTNKNGSSVIDLCLASPAISSFLNLEVINVVESCHFPIKVELGVPSAKRSHIVNKIVWNPAEKEHFNTLLCNSIRTVGPVACFTSNSSLFTLQLFRQIEEKSVSP